MIFWIAVAFAGGLFVGWNFLPQPAWVRRIYDRWFGTNLAPK